LAKGHQQDFAFYGDHLPSKNGQKIDDKKDKRQLDFLCVDWQLIAEISINTSL
jgi:hypothetical protein